MNNKRRTRTAVLTANLCLCLLVATHADESSQNPSQTSPANTVTNSGSANKFEQMLLTNGFQRIKEHVFENTNVTFGTVIKLFGIDAAQLMRPWSTDGDEAVYQLEKDHIYYHILFHDPTEALPKTVDPNYRGESNAVVTVKVDTAPPLNWKGKAYRGKKGPKPKSIDSHNAQTNPPTVLH